MPGVVQLYPRLVPKLMLPVVLLESDMTPQLSLIRMYRPLSVLVAKPPV